MYREEGKTEKLCGSVLRSTAPLPSVYWQNAVTSCIGKLWQEVWKYSGYMCSVPHCRIHSVRQQCEYEC